MITPKEIADKTMSPEKRKAAKNDYFAFYIGRPLSYVLTIPFLYTNISPNAVSLISIVPIIIGFVIMCLARSTGMLCLGWGVAAAHNTGILGFLNMPSDIYIILGALSGIFVIFPRFIMHKAITTLGDETALAGVKDKSQYSIVKLIALNLTSIAGFVQVLMLIAILINALDLFTLGYFVLNLLVCIVSLKSVFCSV